MSLALRKYSLPLLLLALSALTPRFSVAWQFDPVVVRAEAVALQPTEPPSPSDLVIPQPPEVGDVDELLSDEVGGMAFYFQAESLFWQRQNCWTDRPIVVDGNTQAPLFTTHDLNVSPHAAPRLTLGYWFAPNVAFEGVYFGLFDWASRDVLLSQGILSIPQPLQGVVSDYHFAGEMQLAYSSRLNSAEGNFVLDSPGVRWLAGFRYVELSEHFNLRAFNAEFEGPGGTGSDYTINTANHLFGAQAGTRWQGGTGWFGWQTDLKGGLFANCALEHQILRDEGNTLLLRDSTGTTTCMSALAEFNLSCFVQITPRWAAVAGYNVLWIGGVALAPDQVDFSLPLPGGTTVRHDAGIFMHGASVGLQAQW